MQRYSAPQYGKIRQALQHPRPDLQQVRQVRRAAVQGMRQIQLLPRQTVRQVLQVLPEMQRHRQAGAASVAQQAAAAAQALEETNPGLASQLSGLASSLSASASELSGAQGSLGSASSELSGTAGSLSGAAQTLSGNAGDLSASADSLSASASAAGSISVSLPTVSTESVATLDPITVDTTIGTLPALDTIGLDESLTQALNSIQLPDTTSLEQGLALIQTDYKKVQNTVAKKLNPALQDVQTKLDGIKAMESQIPENPL